MIKRPRQRSKEGATLGWELDPSIPVSVTPIAVGGKLVLYDAAARRVYFAEACVFDDLAPDPPTPPPAPPP